MAGIQKWDCKFATEGKQIKPVAMIVSASRNQGKSYLIKDIITNIRNSGSGWDMYIVFSNTLENGFYQDFIPGKTKYGSYDPTVIRKLLTIQKEKLSENKRPPSVLVIFDDCVSNKMIYDEEINFLFTRGRHLNLSVIFITQSPTMVNSVWRQNTTHLFVLRSKGKSLDHILDNFLQDLFQIGDFTTENYSQLEKKIRLLLKFIFEEKYRCLVCLYDNEGNDWEQCVKWYKAN